MEETQFSYTETDTAGNVRLVTGTNTTACTTIDITPKHINQ
jgi:hypothetical protein